VRHRTQQPRGTRRHLSVASRSTGSAMGDAARRSGTPLHLRSTYGQDWFRNSDLSRVKPYAGRRENARSACKCVSSLWRSRRVRFAVFAFFSREFGPLGRLSGPFSGAPAERAHRFRRARVQAGKQARGRRGITRCRASCGARGQVDVAADDRLDPIASKVAASTGLLLLATSRSIATRGVSTIPNPRGGGGRATDYCLVVAGLGWYRRGMAGADGRGIDRNAT